MHHQEGRTFEEQLKTCQPYGRYKNDRFYYDELEPDDRLPQTEWHLHDEVRSVYVVISGRGWQFQYDNQDPILLCDGDLLHIPKNTWHRLIPGRGKLVIKITEFSDEIV